MLLIVPQHANICSVLRRNLSARHGAHCQADQTACNAPCVANIYCMVLSFALQCVQAFVLQNTHRPAAQAARRAPAPRRPGLLRHPPAPSGGATCALALAGCRHQAHKLAMSATSTSSLWASTPHMSTKLCLSRCICGIIASWGRCAAQHRSSRLSEQALQAFSRQAHFTTGTLLMHYTMNSKLTCRTSPLHADHYTSSCGGGRRSPSPLFATAPPHSNCVLSPLKSPRLMKTLPSDV